MNKVYPNAAAALASRFTAAYTASSMRSLARRSSGLMRRREASINDVPIGAGDRRFLWQPQGPRPADHPGLSELGL